LRKDFYQFLAQTTPHPLAIDISHAEGTFIYDKSGKKYFDLVAGIAVCNLGHRHPKVIEAIKRQLDKYLHVMPYGELIQDPQVELAKVLANILPGNLSVSYFVNSGAEAVEASLKLAKRVTGRSEIISFHKSYHGNTHGALSVSGNENKKYAFRPLLPGIKFIEYGLLEDLEQITTNTAGVIIEPIQGDAGVRVPSLQFMQALRKKCDETGTQLIFDEIQTGFGRTGKMFAMEHYSVTPDIVALANIDVLSSGIIESVEEKGALFEELIAHPSIKDFRRKGLMMAIEFKSFEVVEKIVKACLAKGVIAFWFLSNNVSFRLQPPLTISKDEIQEACALIVSAIQEVAE